MTLSKKILICLFGVAALNKGGEELLELHSTLSGQFVVMGQSLQVLPGQLNFRGAGFLDFSGG